MRFPAFARVAPLLVSLTLLAGCESAEKKCERSRGSASQLWGSYGQELQAELEATKAALADAKKKLEGEINQRHEAEARRHADELHGTETSTAWYRTFLATTKAQCAKDPECLELKVQLTEGEAKVADLSRRIAAAQSAQAAATGKVDAAKEAADAVPADARASFEPARAASAEVSTLCADVKP